jgi:hypothetical protein
MGNNTRGYYKDGAFVDTVVLYKLEIQAINNEFFSKKLLTQ